MNKISTISLFMIALVFIAGCDRDGSKWKDSKKLNTISSYEEYLNEYPGGKYVKEAKKSIDRLEWISRLEVYLSVPEMLSKIDFNADDGIASVLDNWESVKDISYEWHDNAACYEIRCAAYAALEVGGTLQEVPVAWMYIFSEERDQSSIVVICDSKGVMGLGEIRKGFDFTGRVPIGSIEEDLRGHRQVVFAIADSQGNKTVIVDFEIAGISKPNSPYPSSNDDNFIYRQVGNIVEFINEKKLCSGLLISDTSVIAEQSWKIGQTDYRRRMLVRDAYSGERLEDAFSPQIHQLLWNSGVGVNIGRDRPQAENSSILLCQGDVIRSFNADLITSEEYRKYDTEINQKVASGEIQIYVMKQLLKKDSNIWNEVK